MDDDRGRTRIADKASCLISRWRPEPNRLWHAGFKPFTPKPGAVYLLNVSFALKKDQRWASAGYEVAAAQFELPLAAPAAVANSAAMPALKLAETATNITVKGNGFAVVFNKETGTFSQLTRDGKNLLVDGGGTAVASLACAASDR